jgi:DNA-directed RNA polymerase subunit RPC12/RpoP
MTPDSGDSCPRCSRLIVSSECTAKKPHPACATESVVAGPQIHWRCTSCGMAWVEMRMAGRQTSCPRCSTDLAEALSLIPDAIAEGQRPFPFRCTHCFELVTVHPSGQGPTVQRFARGWIEKPKFQKRKDKGAGQAG